MISLEIGISICLMLDFVCIILNQISTIMVRFYSTLTEFSQNYFGIFHVEYDQQEIPWIIGGVYHYKTIFLRKLVLK